jgi:hypothetical protein
LDPRRKDKWIRSIGQEHAEEEIETVIKFIQAKKQAEPMEFTLDFDDDLDMCDSNHKSDILRYLEDPSVPNSSDFDILAWWRLHAQKYPTMARVARDFLGIPSASVSVERIFNFGRDQFGIRRHCLSPETLQQLMVVKHLEQKRCD